MPLALLVSEKKLNQGGESRGLNDRVHGICAGPWLACPPGGNLSRGQDKLGHRYWDKICKKIDYISTNTSLIIMQ